MLRTSILSHGRNLLEISGEDKSIWRRFRRNVSISVFGAGLTLVIKLIQTAILTSTLKIEDYGRVLIVVHLFLFLDSFLGLRVNDVMFRFFQPLKEEENYGSLRHLLWFCFGISLASGLLVCGVVLTLSPLLADRIYPGLALSPLFNIYAFTILVSTFTGFYDPILRIHNRFSSIVVPQVLGSLTTLSIFCFYFILTDAYNLKIVVIAFAVGVVVQSLPPLVQSLLVIKPLLMHRPSPASVRTQQRPHLLRCLFHSNLSGYLKIGLNPGDLFFLGLFSTPTQVALYGLAKQLTAPLSLLTTNTLTAVVPEITSLVARRKFEQLTRLLSRYVKSAAILSAAIALSAFVLGRIVFFNLFQPQYRDALLMFDLLICAVGTQLVFLVFRPLAVCLDLLKWQNLGLLVSSSAVVIVALEGGLSALSMAFIQLGDVLIVRLLVNLLVWLRLRRLTAKSEKRLFLSASTEG